MVMSRRIPMEEFERLIRRRIDELVRGLVRDVSGMVEESLESIKPALRQVIERDYLVPGHEVYVKDGQVVVVVELPGASKDAIDLRVSERTLTLEAGFSKKLSEEIPEAKLLKRKGYRAVVDLPEEVDPEAGTASYVDGILVVRLPAKKPKGVKVEIE
ncbi:MAG TPA: Hsp20/alpha crystallin family protein [Nitrososphaeria archaeon]|nr:Hsp20/alpha crystallin family protein [Nitrososphaeria archaeon]